MKNPTAEKVRPFEADGTRSEIALVERLSDQQTALIRFMGGVATHFYLTSATEAAEFAECDMDMIGDEIFDECDLLPAPHQPVDWTLWRVVNC